MISGREAAEVGRFKMSAPRAKSSSAAWVTVCAEELKVKATG